MSAGGERRKGRVGEARETKILSVLCLHLLNLPTCCLHPCLYCAPLAPRPQLAAASLQEGMETLAQTLRTRTCSSAMEDRQVSMSRLTRASASAAVEPSPPIAPVLPSAVSAHAIARMHAGNINSTGAAGGQRPGGGGRVSSGGPHATSITVERAQLYIELNDDLETRHLLQLLAPAKRTARWEWGSSGHGLCVVW